MYMVAWALGPRPMALGLYRLATILVKSFRLAGRVISVGPILASSYDKVEANQISADGVGQNGGNANSVRPSAFLERE